MGAKYPAALFYALGHQQPFAIETRKKGAKKKKVCTFVLTSVKILV